MWDTEEEEVVEEEEEKNVTGCGDNICQGNKRSYSTCSFWPRPHVSGGVMGGSPGRRRERSFPQDRSLTFRLQNKRASISKDFVI